jgi:hypothetical protein
LPEICIKIIDRLIQAATEVHGGGQLFTEPGQFPSPRFVELPISPDAERYLRLGPTFLRRHLPFWAAAMVERFMIMLIPIVTLLLPLLRFAPPVYKWQVRRRIFRCTEAGTSRSSPGRNESRRRADILTQLDGVEKDAKHSRTLGYATKPPSDAPIHPRISWTRTQPLLREPAHFPAADRPNRPVTSPRPAWPRFRMGLRYASWAGPTRGAGSGDHGRLRLLDVLC